jgi:hypothetical protein
LRPFNLTLMLGIAGFTSSRRIRGARLAFPSALAAAAGAAVVCAVVIVAGGSSRCRGADPFHRCR